MRALTGALLLALIAHAASSRAAPSDERPRFYLCRGFVEDIAVSQQFKVSIPQVVVVEWVASIKLTPVGTSALAEFTRAHLGKVARVLVGSSLVSEGYIVHVLDSGGLLSAPHEKPTAEALATLLRSPPAAPCGELLPERSG
jgi:preprotein translocase subunit SecD